MISEPIRMLVGKPYGEPYHCGTLAALALREYGVDVGEISETEPDEILGVIARAGLTRAEDPADGDLLLFRLPHRFANPASHHHVGVMVENPVFIHAMIGHGVALHSLAQAFWRRYLVSAFRRPVHG